MDAFATLLERLAFTPSRNGKRAILVRYFREVPDPSRGYALAALTGELGLRRVRPTLLRELVVDRIDSELFAWSYDFVGDLAETVALVWPDPPVVSEDRTEALDIAETAAHHHTPTLARLVEELETTPRASLLPRLAERLDSLDASARLAYLKLATGGLRVGVSARLARLALAEFGGVDVTDIEELWHGLSPPYVELFAWLEGGEKPVSAARAPFRPVMLSTPITPAELEPLPVADYVAEWKWDGIRVQAVCDGGERRLYSRTGEDISAAFPDLLDALVLDGTIDGELLVRRDGEVQPFGDLQKRLNRKTVSKGLMASHPAFLRAYDALLLDGVDLRERPFHERRARLEAHVPALDAGRVDLSPLLRVDSWDALATLRAAPPHEVIEGVMIKRRDSPYLAGRVRGHWFKWKREPMRIDAVLLYAQRGHGKRSGYYSDFTFGVWHEGSLVPVGKAYFGFTDEELRELDRFVRHHTTERFGPVRAVAPTLVLEIAFEGLNASTRHKSGVAMRFPRIARIRHDKPAAEADTLAQLRQIAALPE